MISDELLKKRVEEMKLDDEGHLSLDNYLRR
jgi:hypothetical protein